MRKSLILIVCCALLTVLGVPLRAANWPQWRGPRLNGSSPETNLPTEFGPDKNVAWSVELPGRGGSTPIIWEKRIFLSAQDEEKRTYAMCLSTADGGVLWKHHVGEGYQNRRLQTACTPSAVTDGEKVWFLYGNGDLAAFDLQGEKLWQRDLEEDHGQWEIRWDYGSSPLLWKGKLYIPVIHGDYRKDRPPQPRSYLLCVDPDTGKDLWKHMRPSDADSEAKQAYSTPIPLPREDGDQLLVVGADHLTGHVAATGRELWRSPTYNPRKIEYFPIVASPAVADGMVVICAPRGAGLYAAKPNTNEWAWKLDRTAGFSPTPAVWNNDFYVLDDQSRQLYRIEPQTGKVLDQCRIGGSAMLHPSPTVTDGKIYCIDNGGHAAVVSANKPLKVLHETSFGGRKNRATIAVAGGCLFVRTAEKLYCIKER